MAAPFDWRGVAEARRITGLPLDGRRRHAVALLEQMGEMRGAAEAPGKGDIGQGLARSRTELELFQAFLQTLLPDVAGDRRAFIGKGHVEIALRAIQGRRELLDAQVRIAQVLANEGVDPG